MRRLSRKIPLVTFALLTVILLVVPAHAWIRSPATTFAVMPPGATPPEGITADAKGNIYVTTFGVPASGFTSQPGQLVVFSPSGQLVRQVTLSGGAPKGVSPNLLGLAFHPITGELLVLDFGHQQVLSVNPVSGVSSVFASMPVGAGINALTFDRSGNVYVSDSFLGVIWRTDMGGNNLIQWVSHPLLTTSGIPPFGANGIAFNATGDALFVANTGSDQVIRIPVTGSNSMNPTAGTPKIFVNSINGADGLIIDAHENIWVCANQGDEIVVVDPTGRVIAKLGDFGGIDPHGNPIGLLFPASLVFSGEFLYVTNLSLDLRLFNQDYYAVDSQWAAQVTTSTVAKIRARIPPIPGSHQGNDDSERGER